MALTFIGETDFVQSGQPQWQQSTWELDNLVVPYSGAEPNLNSFLDSLEKGQPSDIDPDMLLTDWRVGGSKFYPSVDLVYLGKKNGILPPSKHEYDSAVQSATSSKLSGGATLLSPATLQYYAPTSTLSYFTLGAPGTTEAPDPIGNPIPITLTISDITYSSGGSIQESINQLFMLQILSTIASTEMVPEQYWQNTAHKVKSYSPWIFDVTSGGYLSMYSPGNGYTAGNTLTVSSGGESATVVVDSVGSIWGGGTGIISWHQTANTFTVAHTALSASGGSGSGAGFNVFIIP